MEVKSPPQGRGLQWSLLGCCIAMLGIPLFYLAWSFGYDAGHDEGVVAAYPRAFAIGRVEGFRLTIDRHAGAKMYDQAYDVRDVMYARLNKSPDQPISPAEADAVFDQLIAEITEEVDPDSWPQFGGTGGPSIRGFPTNLCLVVSQTAGNHAEIASYLYSKEDFLAWKKASETR